MKQKIIRCDPELGFIVGDSHRYINDNGEISLVYPCQATLYTFEIYCIKGNLFEDIERYETLSEAEERITQLLGESFKLGR